MSNETSGYEPPKTENFKFFSHRQCEYFPCHQLKGGMAEEDFNCLFCYCLSTLWARTAAVILPTIKGSKTAPVSYTHLTLPTT